MLILGTDILARQSDVYETNSRTDGVMKMGNVTGLFFLSVALLSVCVSSQSCTSGWFGRGCKYKCRCQNDTCDVSGSCTAPFTCQGGWFGPACQYADIAYLRAPSEEVTDGDDSTCNTTTQITIPLGRTYFFTWMRVIISGTAPAALDKLTVTFSDNTTLVDCDKLKTYVVNNRTVDLNCDLTEEIDELTLDAKAVSGLCSVYVSGGRNVALKENAHQDKTWVEEVNGVNESFPANLAVDGGLNQDFHMLSCSISLEAPTWTLSLSMPRRVHRYVIYNRVDNGGSGLLGFRLRSFDSSNNSVFEYNDPNKTVHWIYTMIHKPTPIDKIEIRSFEFRKMIQLCEVEVYGDSDCDHDRHGRDCELSCNCPYWEPCFVHSGGCPYGCPVGFHGDGCVMGCSFGKFGEFCNESCSEKCDSPANTTYCNISTGACLLGCKSGFEGEFCQDECPAGKHGPNCNSSCSQNCIPTGVKDVSPCDRVTGSCRKGCKDGFTGSPCVEECPVGKFGANCSSSCSQNCMPADVNDVPPCDPVTGVCRKGCKGGFSGSSCLAESVTTSDTDLASIIVGLCLFFAAIAFFSYCFCKKRSATPSAERKAASVHPELLN